MRYLKIVLGLALVAMPAWAGFPIDPADGLTYTHANGQTYKWSATTHAWIIDAVSMSQLADTVEVADGGTGRTSLDAGAYLRGAGQGAVVSVGPAAVKADIGLVNVQNVDQTNADNLASGTLATARLPVVPVANGGTGAAIAATALANLGGLSQDEVDSRVHTIRPELDYKNSNTTKALVGLGNVENYGVASQAEAEAGNATNVYMTPERTRQAVAAQAVQIEAMTTAARVAYAATAGPGILVFDTDVERLYVMNNSGWWVEQ